MSTMLQYIYFKLCALHFDLLLSTKGHTINNTVLSLCIAICHIKFRCNVEHFILLLWVSNHRMYRGDNKKCIWFPMMELISSVFVSHSPLSSIHWILLNKNFIVKIMNVIENHKWLVAIFAIFHFLLYFLFWIFESCYNHITYETEQKNRKNKINRIHSFTEKPYCIAYEYTSYNTCSVSACL